jgi:hypothetical protein
VRFQPPDDNWRNYVTNLAVDGQPVNALNVYLLELRENRNSRSNERRRQVENGLVVETAAPRQVDCHYFISAWSPAEVTVAVEPTLDEHALLYKVTAALILNEPLLARRIYAPDPLPATFPGSLADREIPLTVLPMDGFPKLAEFWGTVDWRWKPGVYVIASLPVEMRPQVTGPMVTTRITEYRLAQETAVGDVYIQIGGVVLDSTHPLPSGLPAPVAGALVRLETAAGDLLQSLNSDAAGRFSFGGLRSGTYVIRALAVGLGEVSRMTAVPSPSGEYDVQF